MAAEVLMQELWRPVRGWSAYEVSNLGRIRRMGGTPKVRETRILKQNCSIRYPRIKLCMLGAKRDAYVHHLVAEAFIGARPPGHEINHRDGCKTNNRADNLEYLTDAEHKRHSVAHGLVPRGDRHVSKRRPELTRRGSALPWAKLTEADIPEIRHLIEDGLPYRDIAARYGITRGLVSCIKYGKAWRHVR